MKPVHVLILMGVLCIAFVAGLFILDLLPLSRAVILTVPRGAMVSVGGAPALPSPRLVPVHTTGTRVSVSHPGFHTRDTTLTPGADTVLVYLERLCGISVITEPSGLTVRWREFSAVSPCTIPLPGPGSYEIIIEGGHGIRHTVTRVLLSPELHTLTLDIPVFIPGTPALVRIPESLLPPGLFVGVHEVTTTEFAAFMNSVDPHLQRTGFELPGRTVLADSILRCNWPLQVVVDEESRSYQVVAGMENHPMYGMTQQGAEWFCRWLSESDERGMVYRLPEPGEWRVLAGAGRGWRPEPGEFNCSDARETILARHPEIDDGHAATAPVGAYPPNPWGLYDTAGNLWEWTASPGIAAGGSWLSSVDDCGPETLVHFDPEIGYPFIGFRVVANVHQPPSASE